jgi:hypothetical protein
VYAYTIDKTCATCYFYNLLIMLRCICIYVSCVQSYIICNILFIVDLSGPPVILVLIAGRPRLFNDPYLLSRVHGVLNAYLPGPMGGLAIAETILGENRPSGRLPYTYPRHSADIPYMYYHKPGDVCKLGTCEVSEVNVCVSVCVSAAVVMTCAEVASVH